MPLPFTLSKKNSMMDRTTWGRGNPGRG